MKTLQPPEWAQPKGYANGIAARGTLVFVAGQIGWNAACQFDSDDFVEQAQQALRNIVAVLAEAGGKPEHVVRMTWYVTDRSTYLASGKALGAVYRALFGRHFSDHDRRRGDRPDGIGAKVEIEATAVIPD